MHIVETEPWIFLDSLRRVEAWVEGRSYKAYEPFDGLSSPLFALTFGSQLAERLLQQVVKRFPVNIRPLLGIRPQESTKGRGYMAWGYLKLYKLTGDASYRARAVAQLDWLDRNKSPDYADHSWGNHFPFSGRMVRTKTLEPIIVWTCLIGQAFLDAYEILADERYLDVSHSICRWIMSVPREHTSMGICLSYVAFENIPIHNSNMLGAAMLARTGSLSGRSEYLDLARQAMIYSCSRQRDDGSWFYAEAPNCHWIDNFHTGYNLDSLKRYRDATKDSEFEDSMIRGFRFYISSFFEPDGKPKYYSRKVYPIDIQCASQAIDTLATFSDFDRSSLDMARKVALWTIRHMQAKDGHFFYSRTPYFTIRTPMLHWAQATMYKAMANLLSKDSKEDAIGRF